jgi:hypothetical protein
MFATVQTAWLVLMLLLPGVAAAQESLPKLIKRIQPAIVTIRGYEDEARKKWKQGTGFFINKEGHIVTNHFINEIRSENFTIRCRRFTVRGLPFPDAGPHGSPHLYRGSGASETK